MRPVLKIAVAMAAATTLLSACGSTTSGGGSGDEGGKKLSLIWVDTDGCESAAQYCDYFITSATKNLSGGVESYLNQAAAGKFPSGNYVGTLKNGGVGLAPYHNFKVPAGVKKDVKKVKAEIISGKIKITSPSQPKGSGNALKADAGNGKLKACMVLDTGGVDDKSFNENSWAGMQAASKANKNISTKYAPSGSGNDYTPNLNKYAQQGCNPVIAVGGLMQKNVDTAAKKFPKTHFAEIDADNGGVSNVYGIQYNTAQGAFLAGYVAAAMTKTGTVGTWGGLNIPPVTIYMDGYWEGVQYYNKTKDKKVKVLGWNEKNQKGGTFAGSFTDQNKGKSITQSMVSQGADIVFPVAGASGLGAGAAADAVNK